MASSKKNFPKVLVYSTEFCPWCTKVKSFLTEHKIPFKSFDVGTDEKAAEDMVVKSHQRGVPVIEVGKQIIVGFDESALREALGLEKIKRASWWS